MQQTDSLDDSNVAYERYGDGRPLVLLHGGMAPSEYWRPVLPHFDGYAAIVPQRAGFGTCRDDPAETTAADVLSREVDYVGALLDALRDDDDAIDDESLADARAPVLFGHSFGALVALEAATTLDVGAVVAYEPAVLPADYRDDDLAAEMSDLVDAGERREAVKRYVERVLHPDGVDDLDAWLADWPVWPDCVDLAEEVVRMNRAVERYDLPDRLAVDAPALVLTGTAGPGFLRESAWNVHEALPRSRFVDFDGVGHSGPGEAPERVADELRAFLGE